MHAIITQVNQIPPHRGIDGFLIALKCLDPLIRLLFD